MFIIECRGVGLFLLGLSRAALIAPVAEDGQDGSKRGADSRGSKANWRGPDASAVPSAM